MSSSSSDGPESPGDPADWPPPSDHPEPNFDAVVIQLSKELEWMGLSAIGGGARPSQDANGTLGLVIGAAYELIGAIRQLEHSKRQRDDRARQLAHDVQRCQWLLDRERERVAQRERDAADAREKERRAEERLRQIEATLKKKTEQHRQLLRETQLKDAQWQHAMRRKDVEIERLQQQLLKFLNAKQHGVALAPIEIDVRGSLVAPPGSTTPGRRKRWDRVDESRNHRAVEDKWKMVVSGLEKEIQTLRSDYERLIDTAGAFLEKISRTRQTSEIPQNVKEWIKLPLSLIGTQLEATFNALGDHWTENSHESPKEDAMVRHDAELERGTEPLDTDFWLSKLAEDNRSVFSKSTEPLKCAANNHPPTEDTYCSDDRTTDERKAKKVDIQELKRAIKGALSLDTPCPSIGNCRRASPASPCGDGVTSQAIDPGPGQRSFVTSPRSREECVSVTGRQHTDAAESATVHRPKA